MKKQGEQRNPQAVVAAGDVAIHQEQFPIQPTTENADLLGIITIRDKKDEGEGR